MVLSKTPLVSFIIPYYNGKRYVNEAIKSFYSQTWENKELVVVDDASTDEASRELIERLAQRYGFTLVRHKKNQGCCKALLTGFKISSGDYISVLSQDDLLVNDKTEFMLEIMQKKDLDVLYCNGAFFFDNNIQNIKEFDPTEVLSALDRSGQKGVAELISSKDTIDSLLTQGALYKREIWDTNLDFKAKFLLDDWPFTIKCWREYKTDFDPHVVYKYRFHDGNTHKDAWKWLPARVQVVSEMIAADKKIEVFARMLAYTGLQFRHSNSDDAARFLAAAYVLADRLPESNEWIEVARAFDTQSVSQRFKPLGRKFYPGKIAEIKPYIKKIPGILRLWSIIKSLKKK